MDEKIACEIKTTIKSEINSWAKNRKTIFLSEIPLDLSIFLSAFINFEAPTSSVNRRIRTITRLGMLSSWIKLISLFIFLSRLFIATLRGESKIINSGLNPFSTKF
ncbi:hypothetical protein ES705_26637 [subsurface metagenome]